MAKENDPVYDDILEIPEIEEGINLDSVEGIFGIDAPSGDSASIQRVNPFVGLELTVDQFRNWFGNQGIGGRPYNAVGYHHTYRPNENTWNGLVTLRGMFNYYNGNLGWPAGVGPHLYLYDGTGRYKHGQQLVYVGTHPAANGIAISYRNDRWLHVEHVGYYDDRRMSDEMENLSYDVLKIVTDRRGIAWDRVGPGINSPSRPGGVLFHRDAPNAGKTCPGKACTRLPKKSHSGGGGSSPGLVHRVIAGSFRDRAGADERAESLKSAGFGAWVYEHDGMHRVQVASFSNKSNAREVETRLKRKGFDAFIASEEPGDSFKWPGYVPWQEPKSSGSYTDKYPTHYDFRDDVLEVARELVEKFDVSVNTYHQHPPGTKRNWERVSLDVWGPRGRGYRLDPEIGRKVWNYLWSRPGIRWQWGVYEGKMWVRGRGWEGSPPGPPDSDAQHDLHIHLSYEL